MKSNICGFFKSFVYAGKGFAYIVGTQRNFRFHIVAMLWVTAASFFYDLSGAEYALLMLTFSGVLTTEAVNTAVEKAVDMKTDKYNKLAEAAKDAAAAAVLISAVFSVAVAAFLFNDISVLADIWGFVSSSSVASAGVFLAAVLSIVFVFKNNKIR